MKKQGFLKDLVQSTSSIGHEAHRSTMRIQDADLSHVHRLDGMLRHSGDGCCHRSPGQSRCAYPIHKRTWWAVYQFHDQNSSILQRYQHRRQKRVSQGGTVSPKLFSAAVIYVMGRTNGMPWQCKLMPAISPSPFCWWNSSYNTNYQPKNRCWPRREFVSTNLKRTMFFQNGWFSDAEFTLNVANISKCCSS